MSLDTYPKYGHVDAEEGLDIRHFWTVLRKRKATFFQIFILVLVVGAAATTLSKPVYQTRAKLLVQAGTPNLNILNSDNPLAPILAPMSPDTVSTQIQLIQNRAFVKRAMEKAGIKTKPGIVKPSVKVEAVKDTSIIQIVTEGGNREDIARLADTLLDQHLEETDTLRNSGFKGTLEKMRSETERAKAAFQEANQKMAAFRRLHPTTSPEADQGALQTAYMEAQTALVTSQSNVSSIQSAVARLKSRLSGMKDEIVKSRTLDNPVRASLQLKLDAARVQRIDLLNTFLPDSDQVKEVDEQIAAYQAEIEQQPRTITKPEFAPNPSRESNDKQLMQMEADLVTHQASLSAATKRVASLQGQLQATGQWKPEFDALSQELARAQSQYNSLWEKLQQLEIRNNVGGRTGRVLEYASVPGSPIQPKPMLNIVLATVLGLCLAVGVVFLQEYLDDRIHEPDDLQRLVGLPSLGHVPAMGTGDIHLVSQLASDSHVSEAYRAVRSAIGFAGLDSPVRLLQITSASKGEGKSLTSVNTAMAMAMDGKKVILVDADMRRPSLHKVLTLPLTPGLSEVLVGQKTWQEVAHPGQVPNLQVISAGTMPPNPAELLGARSFVQLLEDLQEHADVVIFDTPPCLPVTDPLIVATRMDAVILVINTGQTRRGAIKHVMGLLGRTRARVVGAVFNRVDAKQGGYYYQYYKHYYADGYYSDTDTNGNGHRRRNGKLPQSVASEDAITASASKD